MLPQVVTYLPGLRPLSTMELYTDTYYVAHPAEAVMLTLRQMETIGEVGVINNISTGLALDIGMRLSRCEPLEMILKSACESYQCRYRILARKQKERAILFTSDISVKISGKLAELFARSLPRPLNIRFIEADYATLQSPQERQVLFDRYEVLILIGPLVRRSSASIGAKRTWQAI